jgi:hypothetical protein
VGFFVYCSPQVVFNGSGNLRMYITIHLIWKMELLCGRGRIQQICVQRCFPLVALGRTAMAEHVEVSARAKLGQEAEPPRRVDAGVESGQERVVQHFNKFPLGPRRPFLFRLARSFLSIILGRRGSHGPTPVFSSCRS